MGKMSIAYAMKKKKMAEGGKVKPSPTPSPPPVNKVDADKALMFRKSFGSAMSHGGKVKGVHKSSMDVERPNNKKEKSYAGESEAGMYTRSKDIRRNEDDAEAHKSKHYEVLGEMKSMPHPKLKGLAEGGPVPSCSNCGYSEGGAVEEDNRKLNQHGEIEEGEQGGGQGFHSESYMGRVNDPHDEYQPVEPGEDMVGRIMKQRQMSYSEGGKVANSDHGVDDSKLADFSPNEFDDLTLRDDLSSDYGDDDNSGDALGNSQEDKDRSDIVARIMSSRKKKDRMPNPA